MTKATESPSTQRKNTEVIFRIIKIIKKIFEIKLKSSVLSVSLWQN
ncbi:hypothetical protein ES703_46121 [subsurface metagenome]|jgi:hypothetical protein